MVADNGVRQSAGDFVTECCGTINAATAVDSAMQVVTEAMIALIIDPNRSDVVLNDWGVC